MMDGGGDQGRMNSIHAVLLTSSLPLFLGALLSDWAYASTYEVQWINFAAWLNAGGMIFAGAALLWTALALLRPTHQQRQRRWSYPLTLLATVVLGFVAALVHARDAWATMPAALVLSLVVFLLALASVWLGFPTRRRRIAR